MTVILIAGGTDVAEAPGWGKLIGLVVAVLLFWAGTSAYTRWAGLKDDSPTPGGITQGGVKAQVSDPRDPTLTPRGSVVRRADPDLEKFVSTNLERMPRGELMRQARALFRKSESTIKRRIREARDARDGVLPEDDQS